MSLFAKGQMVYAGNAGKLPFSYVVDLIDAKFNQDTWYPVQLRNTEDSDSVDWRVYRPERINAYMKMDESHPSWGNHNGHGAYAHLNAMVYVSSWAVRDYDSNVGVLFDKSLSYINGNKHPMVINVPNAANQLVIYFRGGAKYYVECDMQCEIIIRDTVYNSNGETIAPTKTPQQDSRLIDLVAMKEKLDSLKSGGVINPHRTTYINHLQALEVA